jgi:hypothetical protein
MAVVVSVAESLGLVEPSLPEPRQRSKAVRSTQARARKAKPIKIRLDVCSMRQFYSRLFSENIGNRILAQCFECVNPNWVRLGQIDASGISPEAKRCLCAIQAQNLRVIGYCSIAIGQISYLS